MSIPKCVARRELVTVLAMRLPAIRRISSALCVHIDQVVPCGPEKEMLGINARRVVAGVTNEQAERVEPPGQLPRNYMGCPDSLCGEGERAIAAYRVCGSRPHPAMHSKSRVHRPIPVDLCPESFGGGFVLSHTDKIPLSHRGNNTFLEAPI